MTNEERTKLYCEFQLRLNTVLSFAIEKETKQNELVHSIADLIQYIDQDLEKRSVFIVWLVNLYTEQFLKDIDQETAMELLMQSSLHSIKASVDDA